MGGTPGIDEILRRNAAVLSGIDLPRGATLALAVLACMDARLDVYRALGLCEGDAHVIRNAGGLATEDAVRSLLVSQIHLGTREVLVMGHTDCAMTAVPSALGGFSDVDLALRDSLARIRDVAALPHRESIRGFVLDLSTLRLREVTEP
jgi:carbonic anhydrase